MYQQIKNALLKSPDLDDAVFEFIPISITEDICLQPLSGILLKDSKPILITPDDKITIDIRFPDGSVMTIAKPIICEPYSEQNNNITIRVENSYATIIKQYDSKLILTYQVIDISMMNKILMLET